jgi:hypothetical protein
MHDIERIETYLSGQSEMTGATFITDQDAVGFMVDFLTLIKDSATILVKQ